MTKRNIISLFVIALTFSGFAQDKAIKKATKKYEKFSYVKTSEVLLEVAEKGFESKDLFQKLGDSFYFNNKMEDASKWYGKLLNIYSDVDVEYYYRYAQTLKATKNYNDADKWMQKFAEAKSSDLRSKSFVSQPNYLNNIERLSEDLEIKNLDINSKYSDFGSNQYKNQLLFASSRGDGRNYKWNNQPFLDVYAAIRQEDGSYTNVKSFDNAVNTKFHESTPSFLPTEDIMYFTRNNYFRNQLKRDDEGINRLQMFRAKLQDDKTWGNIKPVHFNSASYSVAHPSVNTTGTKLYFASDMPGSIGNSDLYVVDIKQDGSLGEPINLSATINTEGQETFPYVNSHGDLYFASNGHPGLGGLDIFVIRGFEQSFDGNKSYSIENLGRPINSSMDDFGYYENLKTMEGFFTSNRASGKGDDDIYSFKVPECLQNMSGVIYDKKSNKILANANVVLFNAQGNKVSETVSNAEGNYSFSGLLKCQEQYSLRASKELYLTAEHRVYATNNRKEDLTQNMYLEIDDVAITQGTNLREALNLNPIYFDFDKANIRADAEIELQKVIAVLKKYPNIKIDVRSHTDSRATKNYNLELSSRRNVSTIDYIIKVGNISADRLTGKGYGESQLTNKCSDGVPCSEEEHQLNRRSDFIVMAN
ncbi:OmpA family protein [Hwangdonia lutea]|uniref:OmpA family protein n=1 Tax=Hwangdonia lutea TaxID=3075823 RepID=A0AA97HQC6_9FLAO|nr:OmpA family protein [Hwangdonia sp. SCSIO 19198]WOD42568.1 OmpA family protein [Hwangdonia sp. SCSIO 19198]